MRLRLPQVAGHVCQAVATFGQHRPSVGQLVGVVADRLEGAAQVLQQGAGLLHTFRGIFWDVPDSRGEFSNKNTTSNRQEAIRLEAIAIRSKDQQGRY